MAPRPLLAFWADGGRAGPAGRLKRRLLGAALFMAMAVALVCSLSWWNHPAAIPALTGVPVEHEATGIEPGKAASVVSDMEHPVHPETVIDPRLAGSPAAAELNAPGGSAQHDVETLHLLLRQYLRHLGGRQGLPIGNDSDLARALAGHNPLKLTVLPITHPALRRDGRLCDRWGTPYFIHPRGAGAYEIRSAGPDRKLFTEDDAVTGAGEETGRW